MLSEARTPWSFVTSRLLYRPKTLLSTVGNTSQLKDTAYFMHTGLPATIRDIHLILCMVTNVCYFYDKYNKFCIFFFYFWRNAAYFQSELFRNVVQSARKSSECNVSKMNSCRSPNNERVTLWALTSISTKSCQVTINIQIQTISLTYHIHLLNNQ